MFSLGTGVYLPSLDMSSFCRSALGLCILFVLVPDMVAATSLKDFYDMNISCVYISVIVVDYFYRVFFFCILCGCASCFSLVFLLLSPQADS